MKLANRLRIFFRIDANCIISDPQALKPCLNALIQTLPTPGLGQGFVLQTYRECGREQRWRLPSIPSLGLPYKTRLRHEKSSNCNQLDDAEF